MSDALPLAVTMGDPAGVGPLIAGCLAQWASWPLTLAYVVFIALGAIALLGLATVPETGSPGRAAPSASRPAGSHRPWAG